MEDCEWKGKCAEAEVREAEEGERAVCEGGGKGERASGINVKINIKM